MDDDFLDDFDEQEQAPDPLNSTTESIGPRNSIFSDLDNLLNFNNTDTIPSSSLTGDNSSNPPAPPPYDLNPPLVTSNKETTYLTPEETAALPPVYNTTQFSHPPIKNDNPDLANTQLNGQQPGPFNPSPPQDDLSSFVSALSGALLDDPQNNTHSEQIQMTPAMSESQSVIDDPENTIIAQPTPEPLINFQQFPPNPPDNGERNDSPQEFPIHNTLDNDSQQQVPSPNDEPPPLSIDSLAILFNDSPTPPPHQPPLQPNTFGDQPSEASTNDPYSRNVSDLDQLQTDVQPPKDDVQPPKDDLAGPSHQFEEPITFGPNEENQSQIEPQQNDAPPPPMEHAEPPHPDDEQSPNVPKLLIPDQPGDKEDTPQEQSNDPSPDKVDPLGEQFQKLHDALLVSGPESPSNAPPDEKAADSQNSQRERSLADDTSPKSDRQANNDQPESQDADLYSPDQRGRESRRGMRRNDDDSPIDDELYVTQTHGGKAATTQQQSGRKPIIVRPQTQSQQRKSASTQPMQQSSRNNKDPLFREAMTNLGITKQHLEPPTEAMVHQYTREPQFYSMIEQRLIERSERMNALVMEERDRIEKRNAMKDQQRRVRSSSQTQTRSVGASTTRQSDANYQAAEEQRIERTKALKKKETEALILRILKEEEMTALTEQIRQDEIEEKKKQEIEVRRQRQRERERMAQILAAQDEKEQQMRLQAEKRHQEAVAKEEAFQQRRAQHEAERTKAFKIVEQQRRERNLKAKMQAEQENEARERQSAITRAKIAEREIQWKADHEAMLEEKRRIRQEEAKKHEALVLQKERERKEILENKRRKVDQQIKQAEITYGELLDRRRFELENMRQKEVKKQDSAKTRRAQNDVVRQQQIEEMDQKEVTTSEKYQELLSKNEVARRQRRLIESMKADDVKMKSGVLEMGKVARLKEQQEDYEERQRQLQLQREEYERELQEAARIRRELERKKQLAAQSGTREKDVDKSNIRSIAAKYEIDYEELQAQAHKSVWRGRSSYQQKPSSSQSQPLPPISQQD